MRVTVFFAIFGVLISTANAEQARLSPLPSLTITSPFGVRVHPIAHTSSIHYGIDLEADTGQPVRSIGHGNVGFAGALSGYGNFVVIKHAQGVTSHYAHLDRYAVNVGQRVKTGEVVGEVGATGMTTGPHLHFELRINGIPINPEILLKPTDEKRNDR